MLFLPQLLLSAHKFKNTRRTLRLNFLKSSLPAGNKDSWRFKKPVVKFTSTTRSCISIYNNLDFVVIQKLCKQQLSCNDTTQAIFAHSLYRSLSFKSSKSSAIDSCSLVTIFGYSNSSFVLLPLIAAKAAGGVHVSKTSRSVIGGFSSAVAGFNTQMRQFLTWYSDFSWALFYYIFVKIKYKGKSYKWHKKRTALVLRFGYSHVVFVKIPDTVFSKKAGKMKLVFYGTNRYELRKFLISSISWRPMNIYNGRGLRFARQVVFRKAGKVSAYR